MVIAQSADQKLVESTRLKSPISMIGMRELLLWGMLSVFSGKGVGTFVQLDIAYRVRVMLTGTPSSRLQIVRMRISWIVELCLAYGLIAQIVSIARNISGTPITQCATYSRMYLESFGFGGIGDVGDTLVDSRKGARR